MNVYLLDGEQADTILAALRFYQAALASNDDLLPPEVADIATNFDAHEPLGAESIDLLCVGLNGGGHLDVTTDLVSKLTEIVNMADEEEPEAEDYDDTESAFSNGHDVASWAAATHAKQALRILRQGRDDTPAFDIQCDDSVNFTATVARLQFSPDSAYPVLARLVRVAQDIERAETEGQA